MTTAIYRAEVRKIDTENQNGNIQVACADIVGDLEATIPIWIEPRLAWGWFVVPDIGETVFIEFKESDEDDDWAGQVSIDAPDFNWPGARYYSENIDNIGDATRINDIFKTNYGKRRGFCTPFGHTIMFDDTSGDSKIYISASVKPHTTESGKEVAAELTNQIILDKDGIHIHILGGNALTLANNEGDATAKIGDGGVSVAIAEHLKTLWDSQKTWLDAHTHPTAMGPSGTPITPLSELWDGNIVSGKVTIPDND